MDTAFESGSPELAENLLRYFVDNDMKECFAACLYTCYDLIRPDVGLELAWRKNMLDFAMPFLIQTFREYTSRIDALDKKTQKKEEAEQKEKSASNDLAPDYIMPGMMGGGMPGLGMPALMAPPQAPAQPQGFAPVGGNMMQTPGMGMSMMQTPGMMP